MSAVVAAGANVSEGAMGAPFAATGRFRLRDPIGEQYESLSWLQPDGWTARVADLRKKTKGRATALQRVFDRSIRTEDISRHMPRACIDHGSSPKVERCHHKGHEAAAAQILYQHLIDLSQNFVNLKAHSGERVHVGAGQCHHQCRAEAMTFYVADGNTHAVLRQRNEVEVVPAGFVCGIGSACQIESGHDGGDAVELFLDLPRQSKLDFSFLPGQSCRDVLHDGDEMRNVSGFVGDRGDRFLYVIGLSGLLSMSG